MSNLTRHRVPSQRAPSVRRMAALAALIVAVSVATSGCTGSHANDAGPDRHGAPGTASNGGVTGTGTDLIPPDAGGSDSADASGGGPSAASPPSATPAGPPAAVLLPWLAGAHASDGVVFGDAGNRLWQGRQAGARAVLGDGWYRYFGPDGSLVGCTSGGACVGVGADGSVAVTTGPDQPRNAYRPNGTYLGTFDADGEKSGAESDPPSLQAALAATGVDVAGLVNAATRAAPFAGGVTGDPHFVTAGGERFTTQLIGQFVARGGDPTHTIQLQLEPMAHREDVSIVSAVAVGTGKTIVTVESSGTVAVDGEPLPRITEMQQVSLGGVMLGRWPMDSSGTSTTALLWPDGSSVVAAANEALGMTVVANLYPRNGAGGLFGTDSAATGTALLTRGRSDSGVPAAISSWRVTSSERLLRAPSTPEPAFPTATATIDPGAAKVAQQLCAASGLASSADRSACAFDVGLTGDTGFIAGHLALGTVAEAEGVPSSFATRWPALLPPPASAVRDLPAGGQLDLTLAAGHVQAYRLSLPTPGSVRIVYRTGCPSAANPPGIDEPAVRVFDAAGHAVSDRMAMCGHAETPALSAGTYLVEVANGIGQPALSVRGDVVLP